VALRTGDLKGKVKKSKTLSNRQNQKLSDSMPEQCVVSTRQFDCLTLKRAIGILPPWHATEDL
jgi:hypothetical protein